MDGYYVFPSPIWVIVVRAFQAVLAFVIIILAGIVTSADVYGQTAFALVCVCSCIYKRLNAHCHSC